MTFSIQQAHQPCFSSLQVAGHDRPANTLGQLQQLGNDLEAAASRSLSSNVPGKLQMGIQARALEHACAQLSRSGQQIAPPDLGAASPVLVNRLVACGMVLKTPAAAEHQPARQALLDAMEGLRRNGDGFYHGQSSAMPRAVERVENTLMAYVRAVGVDTVGNQIMQEQVLPATLLRISQNFPELVERDAQGQPDADGRLMLGESTPASFMQTQRCQGVREAFNKHVAANNPTDLCNALLELTKLPEFVLDGAKARALQPPAAPAAGAVPGDFPLGLGPLGAGQVQQANPVITANPYNYNNVNLPDSASPAGAGADVVGIVQALVEPLNNALRHVADSNERMAKLLDKALDMNTQLRGIGNVSADADGVDHNNGTAVDAGTLNRDAVTRDAANQHAADRSDVDSGLSSGRRLVESHGSPSQTDGRTARWVDDMRLRLQGGDDDGGRSNSAPASNDYDTVAGSERSFGSVGSSAEWPVGVADDNPALAPYLLDARLALRPVDARGTHEMLASDNGDRVGEAEDRSGQRTARLPPGRAAAPNVVADAANDLDLLRLPGLAAREGSAERADWQRATQRVLQPTAEQRLTDTARGVLTDAALRERLGTAPLDQREQLRTRAAQIAERGRGAAPGAEPAAPVRPLQQVAHASTVDADNLQLQHQDAREDGQQVAPAVVIRAAGERMAVTAALPSATGDMQREGGIVPLPGLVAADAQAQLQLAIGRLQSTPAASSMHTQRIVPRASFAALLQQPQSPSVPPALSEAAALRSPATLPPLTAPALVRAQQQRHDAQPVSAPVPPPPPPPMPPTPAPAVVAAAPAAAADHPATLVREPDTDRRDAMLEQIRNFAFAKPAA